MFVLTCLPTHLVAYTGVFNVLDYACVSFPTGLSADKSLDAPDATKQPLGPVCEAIHTECKT